jgi:hypothetical protein
MTSDDAVTALAQLVVRFDGAHMRDVAIIHDFIAAVRDKTSNYTLGNATKALLTLSSLGNNLAQEAWMANRNDLIVLGEFIQAAGDACSVRGKPLDDVMGGIKTLVRIKVARIWCLEVNAVNRVTRGNIAHIKMLLATGRSVYAEHVDGAPTTRQEIDAAMAKLQQLLG